MAKPGPADANNLDDSGIRLSVYRKTRLDLIKEFVPKPDGYLPPRSLPTWEFMPIEQKLPLLPAPPGAIYFSRGPLGKTLFQNNIVYSLADPKNRERVPTNTYEILHDPTARIDENPEAREYLTKHGAVNENGEVICTLKEFNRYRKYLASLYSDKVRQKIAELDEMKEFERETTRALFRKEANEKSVGKQAVRNERIAKGKKFLEEKEDVKRRRYEMKQRMKDQQKTAIEEERKRRQAEKIRTGDAKRRMQVKRIENKETNDIEKRKAYLHQMTLHDMMSVANREHIQKERKIIHDNQLAEWFDAKLVSAAERLQREKEIQVEYSEDMKRRAFRRQKNVERFRAELTTRIAKRLAAKQRLDDIVRKYAIRWLTKVRERLNKPVDELHESLWFSPHKNCLSDGVKYLYEKSGYEKLDDVVLNILKFKEALKKQMLEDEEDEDDEDEY